MKLKHLDLTVTDVEAAREFLERYFELKCGAERGRSFAVMFDDDGMVLTLMKGREAIYPKTFHIGLPQESESKVDEINARLKSDGYEVEPPQRSHAWTFYVDAPGGFTVEVLS